MNPPKTIKVSPFVFEVVHDPDQLSNSQGDAMIDRNQLKVYINRDRPDGNLRDDILHELLHAVYGQTPLFSNSDHGAEQEERIIAALSPRILAVLRENPRLVAWLTEGVT